jgi:hypothetical protein
MKTWESISQRQPQSSRRTSVVHLSAPFKREFFFLVSLAYFKTYMLEDWFL